MISCVEPRVLACASYVGSVISIALGSYVVSEIVCRALASFSESRPYCYEDAERHYEEIMTKGFEDLQKLHPKAPPMNWPYPRSAAELDRYFSKRQPSDCPAKDSHKETQKLCKFPEQCKKKMREMIDETHRLHEESVKRPRGHERMHFVAIALIALVVACFMPYTLIPAGMPLTGKIISSIVGGVVLGAIPASQAPSTRIILETVKE